MAEDNTPKKLTKTEFKNILKTIEKNVIDTFDLQTHSVFITYLENELKARGYDLSDKTLQKQLDNWAMNNTDFLTARGSQGLLYEDLKNIDNAEGVGFIGLAEGLDEDMNVIANIPDTPTNVVDDLARQNELINNFVNSIKTEGNLEFYVKHSGTEVPASSIKYNPRIGIGSQIPGFYTEPLGIRDIKVMGGSGGPNAISNYYKVQVNSNNLLISAGGGKVTGLKSPISSVGYADLGNEIEKIDWKIFEQETGLSWENDFNGKGLFSVENGQKYLASDSQGFIRRLKGMGLTDDEISSALRKSGIEGFVSGPTNAQYEVVLLDPNDELGIGKNINVQDATETDFVKNQSKVNQIDELIIDTPTNVVGNEFVDNYGKTTTGFIDDLPLEKPIKDVFLNAADSRLKRLGTQVATPGGILDTIDIWEIGVLSLVAGAIAYNEIDEIPKIIKNTILRTYNLSQGRPIDAPLRIMGLPVLSVSEYDIDFEYAMETLEKGEKVMPTEIAIDYVQEKAEEFEGESTASGYAYMTPSAKNTDTMETTQKIQPGVQEEKMFEQAKPKKVRSGGGSGAKIL